MSNQNISQKTSELAGQSQMRRDEIVGQASDACHSASQSLQERKDQAGAFFQQSGEQMKSTAQGAADSVKGSLGIGGNNSNSSELVENSCINNPALMPW